MEQLSYLTKQLSNYAKTLDLYYNDSYMLEFLEFYYLNIDFEQLKIFADAFCRMVDRESSENLKNLETAFNAVDNDRTLQAMKEQMIILKPRGE